MKLKLETDDNHLISLENDKIWVLIIYETSVTFFYQQITDSTLKLYGTKDYSGTVFYYYNQAELINHISRVTTEMRQKEITNSL